jgi:hypothetical protein
MHVPTQYFKTQYFTFRNMLLAIGFIFMESYLKNRDFSPYWNGSLQKTSTPSIWRKWPPPPLSFIVAKVRETWSNSYEGSGATLFLNLELLANSSENCVQLQSWQKLLWTACAEIEIPSLANIYMQNSNV